MTAFQTHFQLQTRGRGTYEITQEVQQAIVQSGIETGICQVFTAHTSCSLMICENADPDVRHDLETWMSRTVQDGDPDFIHTLEGPDDMSAHIRSILTNPDLTLPISQGSSALGIWQGIYLWEHRTQGHDRRVTITVVG